MRVLVFGTYNADRHPRVGVLIEGLQAHGDDVVEVNIPLRLDTAARVAMLRQPWRLPMLVGQLVSRWVRLAIRGRRILRRYRPDVVLVGYLGHFDVRLARLLFGTIPIVLDQLVFAADTASDRGVTARWKTRLLEHVDRCACRAADLVMVDTTENQALAGAQLAGRTIAVPVGADRRWFQAGTRHATDVETVERAGTSRTPSTGDGATPETRLRVIFFGLFIPLQGTPVIAEALSLLAQHPEIQPLVIGQGQDLERARRIAVANTNVTWQRWVPAAELPAMVAAQDVCLGIFGTTPKALRVVPNKVYQGAAAGCAVVTSDTPPQRDALGQAGCFVPPGDPVALADTLRALALDRRRLAGLKMAARERALLSFSPAACATALRGRMRTLAGQDGRK